MTTTTNRRRVNVLGIAIAIALLPAMGVAQEVDPSTMHHSAPAPPPTPAKTIAPAKPAVADPHAGHKMPAAPPARKNQAEVDHAAMGHAAPQQEPVDHSKMDHSTIDHSAMGHGMPMARTEPLTPIPEITDADRAAAVPQPHDHPVHDSGIFSYVLFNRLEAWDAAPGTGTQWEAQSWIGTDLNRVWLRSEGEHVDGNTESADLEVLYGRSITPWWDVVAGVRHDFKPGRSQDFLALGVIGLAPYMFEVSATAYLGESGRTEASVEVEYEMLLTNRLILQPLLEVRFFGQTDERRGVGSGLGMAEAGLRVRYEVNRQFAPYIGVARERAFGRTALLRRNEGEDTDDTRVVAGVRIWF